MPRFAREDLLACALLLGAGALLFGSASGFDFVRYDDYEVLVAHHDAFRDPSFAWRSFWSDAFAVLGPNAAGVYYRPLLIATYVAEAQLAGTDPLVYHVTNLGLHLAASAMAYAFFLAFHCRRPLAFALAALFLAHPASAPLVAAWIPCRNESLLAIAAIASVLGLLRFLRARSRAGLVLCVASFVAALFLKESAVVLLPLLAAVVAVEGVEQGSRRELDVARYAALAATALWALLRHTTLGGSPLGTSLIAGNLQVLLAYVGKIFFPIGLAPVPNPQDTSLAVGWAGAATLALLVALAGPRLLPLRPGRALGVPGLGLIWAGAFLAPALLVPDATWGLEHRIYLPLLGVGLLATGVRLPFGLRVPSQGATALVLAIALLFAFVSARRLPHFAGPLAYWEHAARQSPSSALAASRLAWRYYEAERGDDAIAAADRAIALDAGQADMYLLRGIVSAQRGDLSRAARDLERATELDPEEGNAWLNLSRVQKLQGRSVESRRSMRRAEEIRRRATR